jgi:acetyl esterase
VDPGLIVARLGGYAGRAVVSLPAPVLRAATGSPPPAAAGLAPDLWALARLADRLPQRDAPVAVSRRRANAQGMPLARRLAPEVQAHDRTVPGPGGPIPVRTYVPPGAPETGPLLVWLHGGGWVFRTVQTHDASLRFLAARSGVRIASVEYRLAPEHPFPAPLDDALAAWSAVTADPAAFGAAPGRIAVGGDSAGGNLAAAVALAGRDGDVAAPCWQLLLYPVCDVPDAHPSYATFRDGFSLTGASMAWYFEQYAGADRAAWTDPRVAVLRADVAGVAPAHVATALADPLRDEGEAYAAGLRAAGVAVTTHRHPLLHGFLNMTAARSARDGVAQLAGVVGGALG